MKGPNCMLGAAIAFAAEKHQDQRDKAGQPYILHCLKVMHYLRSDDEELNCIAVLHDVIEDTDTKYIDLYNAGFSERVIRGVEALTKQRGESPKEYLDKVCKNIDAMRVKLCDYRHNSDIRRIKGLTQKDFERVKKYQENYVYLKFQIGCWERSHR